MGYNDSILLQLSIPRPWHALRRKPLTDTGIGWLTLSLCVLSGSTFNVFAKMLSPSLSPVSLVFISEIIVVAFILLSFGLIPVVRSFRAVGRSNMLKLLAMGCFSGVIGPSLWFTGLSMTTAVSANFFAKSELLFSLGIAAFVLGERLTRAHFLAAASVLAGLTLIALKGFAAFVAPQPGDLLIVFATLSYATGTSIYTKFLHHVPSHVALCARSLTAVTFIACAMPLLPHSPAGEVSALPLALVPALLGFGFISRFINSVSFYETIERLPISTVSLVGSLDVVLSTTIAWAMLGEPIRWYHVLGGGFVILGTLLLETLHEPRSEHAAEQRQQRQRIP